MINFDWVTKENLKEHNPDSSEFIFLKWWWLQEINNNRKYMQQWCLQEHTVMSVKNQNLKR